ncbi:HEPN domain-containing protein [Mariniflexile gromovii]|uniref:HEPN domain-containing protein n=1 Tax=Mariniflexile gromovii TaxID=362523 RepID=A0ABS4BTX6_9FLAO|nr:HEPN domain-containing protein [Mariniflexile gromovii]MBP0904037.1 HEPN domain-containing protein [Mariniflexile gromovii]
MNQETNSHMEMVVNKLTTFLEVKYIYQSDLKFDDYNKSLLIVVLKGNSSSLTKELSSMVAKIFQEETDFLYRILSFEYAHQQLKEENLFFVHGCTGDKLIFQNSDTELDSFHEYYATEKTKKNIQSLFERERDKIAAFLDGTTFFIEKNNLSHAAYMLHQHIELWFRYVSLFTMGKERKSHSIKELQTYIRTFTPELGNLFNTEIQEEQHLLKLLDDAYITTRYENNYHINLEQTHRILEKANKMKLLATSLFKNKWDACIVEVSNTKEIKVPKQQSFEPKDTDLLSFIKSLSKKDFSFLIPYPFKKGHYTIGIVTEGYLETSFMISNLLKVCIIAMESDYYSTRSIPEPDHNIKEVLGYVLDMIPHNEMKLLDVIKDLVLEPETKD